MWHAWGVAIYAGEHICNGINSLFVAQNLSLRRNTYPQYASCWLNKIAIMLGGAVPIMWIWICTLNVYVRVPAADRDLSRGGPLRRRGEN